MARINGTLVLLSLAGDVLAHVDNADWSSSLSLADVTDKDSAGYREYLQNAGILEASISVSGFADFVATTGNAKELADALVARGNIAFIFGPTAAGSVQFAGNCLFDSHDLGAPNEEGATFSGSASVNGAWTIQTAS